MWLMKNKIVMFKKIKKFIFLTCGGALLLYPLITLADMSSSTYQIYADVISIGGGTFSGGAYDLNGTMGEPTIGITTSSTYEIKGGFQFMTIGESISLVMSSSSLNLGTLSTTTVSQATTTATITTDSDAGYTLAISNVDTALLTAVSDVDGEVTAGSEEYGIGLVGTNKVFIGDRSVIPRNISTVDTAIVNDETDIVFKASISPSTSAGTLSQTVTFTASVNP